MLFTVCTKSFNDTVRDKKLIKYIQPAESFDSQINDIAPSHVNSS